MALVITGADLELQVRRGQDEEGLLPRRGGGEKVEREEEEEGKGGKVLQFYGAALSVCRLLFVRTASISVVKSAGGRERQKENGGEMA